MPTKLDKVLALPRTHEVDAAVITFLPDIQWACGFTGSNGVLLVENGEAHFITDGRYRTQAQQEVREATVHIPGYKLFDYIAEEQLLDGARSVLFQSDHVIVSQLEGWKEQFPEVTWVPGERLLTTLVAAKEEREIDCIRRAQQITDQVFEHLLDIIRPGMTEKELAAEIVYQHLQQGADKIAFDPIVASGSQGALPHARPTDKPIEPGELVVLDFGCYLDGYASDMTRTVAVGEPSADARTVYQTVLEAQQQALEAARAGMSSKALDRVARDVIEQAGYGDYFGHGLGHGVGLQVHEWPRISWHVDEPLPENATVTIEPGVYVPDRFGVRIEDIVVLRSQGCENLTGSSKELVVL